MQVKKLEAGVSQPLLLYIIVIGQISSETVQISFWGFINMYIDLYDNLMLNKRLVRIAGFEVAAYCAELVSVAKQVVKKQTADAEGYFILDREYVERETTLTLKKQLKCDEKLTELGVLIKDPDNPNRISVGVNVLVSITSGEDVGKLKRTSKGTSKEEEKAAKVAGIKATMRRALTEQDPDLRAAYERWIDGMIDAANCRFTKAVVQLFEQTVTSYTPDKAKRLKIIELATINSYRDATWAINRLSSGPRPTTSAPAVNQKIGTAVADSVTF